MLLSVDDPRKTNDVLKAYAGYAGPNKNLIIWSRLPIAFQKIVSATRYFTYDNVKVKARLAKGTPVLVEVDGAKIGAARHWVLFVGDQQMWCPWLNKMLPTSYYPLVGFTDIATQ